jgi:membrane protease YdiL (CAAX protease family)
LAAAAAHCRSALLSPPPQKGFAHGDLAPIRSLSWWHLPSRDRSGLVKDTIMQAPGATRTRLPFEPAAPDFPYYRDDPVTISAPGWLIVLAGVVTGFAALVVPLPFEDGLVSGWLRAAAFVGLPLAGLAIAAGDRWRAIFGPVGRREVKLMVAFAALNIVISTSIGVVVKTFGTATANAGVVDAAGLEGARLASFFAKTGVQLLGEELITILPFLAILTFGHRRAGLGRNTSVLIAWLVSAIIFGLLHLPTYDWNFVQCLVIIGSARLVLTGAYVWTRNIWVSTGAHILNDWLIIASVIFLTPLAAGLAPTP